MVHPPVESLDSAVNLGDAVTWVNLEMEKQKQNQEINQEECRKVLSARPGCNEFLLDRPVIVWELMFLLVVLVVFLKKKIFFFLKWLRKKHILSQWFNYAMGECKGTHECNLIC